MEFAFDYEFQLTHKYTPLPVEISIGYQKKIVPAKA